MSKRLNYFLNKKSNNTWNLDLIRDHFGCILIFLILITKPLLVRLIFLFFVFTLTL